MKTIFMNCKLFVYLWQSITSIIGKLLCFIKKRKLSTTTDFKQTIPPPMSIQIQGENKCEEIKLVDWNTWGDESTQPLDENKEEIELPAEELFKDMEPVINKAKVVHVTKKMKAPPTRSPTTAMNSPFMFQSKHTNMNMSSNRINFNAQYQVESELGTWDDNATSGWDEDIDDQEIAKQTETMIKQTKQQEREKRSEEQRRKRIEKEQQRAQRKNDSIGVKIS